MVISYYGLFPYMVICGSFDFPVKIKCWPYLGIFSWYGHMTTSFISLYGHIRFFRCTTENKVKNTSRIFIRTSWYCHVVSHALILHPDYSCSESCPDLASWWLMVAWWPNLTGVHPSWFIFLTSADVIRASICPYIILGRGMGIWRQRPSALCFGGASNWTVSTTHHWRLSRDHYFSTQKNTVNTYFDSILVFL